MLSFAVRPMNAKATQLRWRRSAAPRCFPGSISAPISLVQTRGESGAHRHPPCRGGADLRLGIDCKTTQFERCVRVSMVHFVVQALQQQISRASGAPMRREPRKSFLRSQDTNQGSGKQFSKEYNHQTQGLPRKCLQLLQYRGHAELIRSPKRISTDQDQPVRSLLRKQSESPGKKCA